MKNFKRCQEIYDNMVPDDVEDDEVEEEYDAEEEYLDQIESQYNEY
jgi:hypothetical protein